GAALVGQQQAGQAADEEHVPVVQLGVIISEPIQKQNHKPN
ncbi:hypothetical protein A2U01_0116990, partial [Trifolium medium]|nr:hypothetical protein [Trifolium medium]